MIYKRDVAGLLEEWLDKREVKILYGARQVGKTTLLRKMLGSRGDAVILNCEQPAVADILESRDLVRIKALFGGVKIVALDEAQKIENIGSLLKLLFDEMPEYRIIATGSSSFDLAGRLNEPLTGRNVKFRLYPLSLNEIRESRDWLWVEENLEQLVIYGTYPGLIDLHSPEKEKKLMELASDYLYRDVLMYEKVRNPAVIRKLLKALALQTGSQVSSNELSGMLGVSRPTVERYLDLLEKSFVIYELSSFSSNLRNEIRKSSKYFFYDTGIRNALLGDFRPLRERVDQGALWENFCISQRVIMSEVHRPLARYYFWRTYDGGEIDLIEENNGKINAFEFKIKRKKQNRLPESFVRKYRPHQIHFIDRENIYSLIQ